MIWASVSGCCCAAAGVGAAIDTAANRSGASTGRVLRRMAGFRLEGRGRVAWTARQGIGRWLGAQWAWWHDPACRGRVALEALLTPLFLSRVQFAFVISFHILFPAFTIGLAHWLAFVEWRWLRTRDELWRDVYFFWLKIFAVSFGMGVVSGIVMSFQFGTNWAVLSERAGNILGPLLSYEVLTAFFLEATFLGVMLFGWKRVSDRIHFFATCMVALGTLISTFWIISANSWMQ